MPLNKNAFIRYKCLDRLLSDRHHYYNIHDLTDAVNEMLYKTGRKEVCQRTIEKDLEALEDSPFYARIERFMHNGRSVIQYRDTSYSIFTSELSNEERHLLHEVLSTLGQFEGLSHFEWLERFKIGLGLDDRRQIISFSNNPYLQNSNLLGTLFDQISNEVVINLHYHTFTNTQVRSTVLHPYLLKQYNERWYLLGAAADGKILNFALDRIDKVEPLPDMKYTPCPDDLYERFEDIVGITLFEELPVEHILFWCSDLAKDYVDTKPLHGSQTRYQGDKEQQLRIQYPTLQGGAFYSIDCISNYELIRLLCSYGKDLLVLHSTGTVADEVRSRVKEMYEGYENVRT